MGRCRGDIGEIQGGRIELRLQADGPVPRGLLGLLRGLVRVRVRVRLRLRLRLRVS